MSKIALVLATILTLSAIVPSIFMTYASTQPNTCYIDYSIYYHSTYSGKHSTTKVLSINLNITSTKISNSKYNNTIIITGYEFTNYSSPFMSSTCNKTIRYTFNFTSKFPLVKEITIYNLSNLLNMTLDITKEFKILNISVNHKINYKPSGTESVTFNGEKYTLDSYKASLYVNASGTNKYANISYTSTMVGKILTFQNGILYKLYLTGESQKNITFKFLNIYSKSSETLCIVLKSTNIKLDSVKATGNTNVKTESSVASSQNTIKPEEFIIPAGIIGLLASSIILARRF